MASVFFDYNLNIPSTSYPIAFDWNLRYPIIAVSTKESNGSSLVGRVAIYDHMGDILDECNEEHDVVANSLSWHPSRKILASGWEDGRINLRNLSEGENNELSHYHKTDISILAWHEVIATGISFLISIDKNSLVILWRVDARGIAAGNPRSQCSLREIGSISQCVVRPVSSIGHDMIALAKAAITGDDFIMEMFTPWNRKPHSFHPEAFSFYVASQEGELIHINERAEIMRVFDTKMFGAGGILKLMYSKSRDILVLVTVSLTVYTFSINRDNTLKEIDSLRLPGKGSESDVSWAGDNHIAIVCGESFVRMLNIEKFTHFNLILDSSLGVSTGQQITSVTYVKSTGVLACGNNKGLVLLWRYQPLHDSSEDELCWLSEPSLQHEGIVRHLYGGELPMVLAVTESGSCRIFEQQPMCAVYRSEMALVQISSNQLSLDVFSSARHHDIQTPIHIRGLALSKTNFAAWDGREIVTYEMDNDQLSVSRLDAFSCSSTINAMHEQTLFTVEETKINSRNMQGVVKQVLVISENLGKPLALDVAGNYLAVGTSEGFLLIYNLAKREAKAEKPPKDLHHNLPKFGEIISIKIAPSGKTISVISNDENGCPSTKLIVWESELDVLALYDMFSDPEEEESSQDSEFEIKDNNSATREIYGRYPSSHYWCEEDSRLLVCELRYVPNSITKLDDDTSILDKILKSPAPQANKEAEVLIATFFIDIPTLPILVFNDSFPLETSVSRLIGFDAPYFYFISKKISLKPKESSGDGLFALSDDVVRRLPMKDFIGLKDVDGATKKALLDFSFYIAYSNMEEAFKSIRLIKNTKVWENMCRMCVKTGSLEIARVCLGHMRAGRASYAVRTAASQHQAALLAVQLGMVDVAEKMLKSSRNYDILNELYQTLGYWDKAVDVAETHDQIHLKLTYYNYAKHLENNGDLSRAIEFFERAGTYIHDVPRLYIDTPTTLKSYVDSKNEKDLLKWWAQYLESKQDFEGALDYYEKSSDRVALVRVNWFLGNFQKAVDLCSEDPILRAGDDESSKEAHERKAGCFYLAQQFESKFSNSNNTKDFQSAINFYMKAEAYSNALKLCKDNNDYEQLRNVASLGTMKDKLDAAKFFEDCQDEDAIEYAVEMYSMAGQAMKVAELTKGDNKTSIMDNIVENMDENTTAAQMKEVAEFFEQTGLYEKAVNLFIKAKDYDSAMRLCEEKQAINLTEEMAERLSPDKSTDARTRNSILRRIANICVQQQQFTLAYKKFQQAGDMQQGFKALLKSGDVDLIYKTAKLSRKAELMIDAANYFKTLAWNEVESILMKIIELYQKAKAFDLLALFYVSCSELEMDEYYAYEKAFDALKEAEKELEKSLKTSKDPARSERAQREIEYRLLAIQRFMDNDLTLPDKDSVVQMTNNLLNLIEDPSYMGYPRKRDVFARLLANYMKLEQDGKAMQCLEKIYEIDGSVKCLRRLFDDSENDVWEKVNLLVESVCTRSGSNHKIKQYTIGANVSNEINNDYDHLSEDEDELDEEIDD